MDDAIDVYAPAGGAPARGAVILVAGYPGKFNRMPSNVAWAQRIAASGLTAVAYANREPVAGLHAVLRHVRETLGFQRVGLWACSGNAPVALSVLAQVQCAALLYPYTIEVPEEAKAYGFATPPIPDPPSNVPLLVLRAGRDAMPGLNETIVRFVLLSLERGVPLTLVNEPDAAHAEDTPAMIEQVLAFFARHL